MVPDCEKNAGDELCMDATCFVHKAFLPAIHPAEPCNYGQSLVHHSNCGCCCPILNPLILSVKPISEISNGLSSLLPRAEVHLSFLWVSQGSLSLGMKHSFDLLVMLLPVDRCTPETIRRERESKECGVLAFQITFLVLSCPHTQVISWPPPS